MNEIMTWEAQLNDFDPMKRQKALHALVQAHNTGQAPIAPPQSAVNLHCHTFFSYNGYGYSPSGIAWLAKKGWLGGGPASWISTCWMESRSSCKPVTWPVCAAWPGWRRASMSPEFATREINSPGEPGIFYLMGVGFTASSAPGSAAQILSSMRQRAEERNRTMLIKLNAHLAPVTADYDRDILPLTPNGNATERHMLEAYETSARRVFPERAALVAFWVDKLGAAPAEIEKLVDNPHSLRDLIRKLMKKGGVGYMTPTPETFPRATEVNEMTIACGALPCATWLDGASAGEQAEEELLTLLIKQGVAALNIIPDRNWNFPDEKTRQAKIAALYQVVKLAQSLDLPLIVGTEMNKFGQKRVDDFDSEALRPLRQAFLDGAYFLYGHTVLQRAAGLGYQSAWAAKHLPARRERNAFYTTVGKTAKPGKRPAVNEKLEPQDILSALR